MFESAEVYKRYAKHRDLNHLSDYEVAKTLKIGRSTFSDWKTGKTFPKTEKLCGIAEMLGVSMDYLLLGREKENTKPVLSPKETSLLTAFRELNDSGKERATEYLGMLKKQPEYLEKNNHCEVSVSEVG